MSVCCASKQTILPLYTVDAFTDQAFGGNGAAICLLPHKFALADDVRQKMAAEMNLSETAFVSILQEKDTFRDGCRFGLRWFTPECEVRLCGHATLASAAVLFMALGNPSPVLEFETVSSGTLSARRLDDGRIELDLPAYACAPVEFEEYEKVAKAAAGPLPIQEVVLSSSRKLLVRLRDHVTRSELEGRSVDSRELMEAHHDLQGVILTLKAAAPPYDFISRYFVPWLGVPEDPVTGSAHCVLAPYWSRVLNKKELYARQCSPRGGDLSLRVESEDRVTVGGHAVVVVHGNIHF